MRQIVCEDCGKRYDYGKDEFCPRCGAFNPPVKIWGMDAQGNVVRVDGVNENSHAGSFVHSEVHKEKRVRQARGMDWGGKKKQVPPPRPAARPQSQGRTQSKNSAKPGMSIIFWIVATIILVNMLLPFLMALFD